MPIWNFISRAAPGDIARAYAKRMGESYWLGEANGDDNSSLGGGVLVFSDCEPEHVPIKTKSNSMFDFMGFQEMRKRLKKNGERFFECRHEESRKTKERVFRAFRQALLEAVGLSIYAQHAELLTLQS